MSRLPSIVLGCVALCVLAPASFGQTFFEPVRYQHQVGNSTFYYGGDNPHLAHWAARQALIIERYGDVGRAEFGRSHNELFHPIVRVYSDLMPYYDVSLLGATPADARNEAMRSVPRYFRKIDLLREAVPMADGTLAVPATAPQIQRVIPRTRVLVPSGTSTRPMTGRILIIPKKKPAEKTTDKLVAAAS
jgi:hypothetical protein